MSNFPSLVAAALFASIGVFSLGACGAGDDTVRANSEPLSSGEIASLSFTREEEKLARDVYNALGTQDAMFENIKQSEQTHMDAILTLLNRYDVSDPVGARQTGEFKDASLKKLHDDLVAEGARSTLNALAVGVAIEELDIRDIENAKKTVTHNDILTTYENLTRGSRNHLRSFYSKLVARGGSYVPQYIDAATFQAIVDSPTEKGGGR